MAAAVLHALHPRPDTVMVDGTVGAGGHSLAILPHLLPAGRLIALDRDAQALAIAERRLSDFAPRVIFLHDDYRHLPKILEDLHMTRVDGVLLDLGMSSLQVDAPERGFSFLREGPLDMRMDPDQEVDAARLVNHLSAGELAMILETLGEERFAQRIARRVVQVRRAHPILTTTHLARVVAEAVPPRARHGRLHPATRTFQALRMAVNDELGALGALLEQLPALLTPGGRAVILTFHSLDDRLVKHAFAEGQRQGVWSVLTKKPLRPAAEEVSQNPRARSAKLRAVEQRPAA